mgnify:CR=1 FL=1
MLVVKRNKTVQPFDWGKIDLAITKAFHAVNEPIDMDILSDVKDELYFNNIISVEEIQDQIEKALMAFVIIIMLLKHLSYIGRNKLNLEP